MLLPSILNVNIVMINKQFIHLPVISYVRLEIRPTNTKKIDVQWFISHFPPFSAHNFCKICLLFWPGKSYFGMETKNLLLIIGCLYKEKFSSLIIFIVYQWN